MSLHSLDLGGLLEGRGRERETHRRQRAREGMRGRGGGCGLQRSCYRRRAQAGQGLGGLWAWAALGSLVPILHTDTECISGVPAGHTEGPLGLW